MKIMPCNIALIYGNDEKKNASDTFEDLQNELNSWGLENRKLKNDRIKCGETVFSFVNIEDNEEFLNKSGFFNKIYMCESVRPYEFQITTICESSSFHPYPFQCLVDLVLDAKNNSKTLKKACAL